LTGVVCTVTNGQFWRVVFASQVAEVLRGAHSPEGRYHHDGQRALYISQSPDYARIAVDAYLKPDDPPRLIVPLALSDALLLDVRDPLVQRQLGLKGPEANTLWQPERAKGLPATSWIASDAVRNAGADGMIYGARSDPTRWHIVLFRWNAADGAQIRQSGPPIPF
jgi:RES domain-containing protein